MLSPLKNLVFSVQLPQIPMKKYLCIQELPGVIFANGKPVMSTKLLFKPAVCEKALFQNIKILFLWNLIIRLLKQEAHSHAIQPSASPIILHHATIKAKGHSSKRNFTAGGISNREANNHHMKTYLYDIVITPKITNICDATWLCHCNTWSLLLKWADEGESAKTRWRAESL